MLRTFSQRNKYAHPEEGRQSEGELVEALHALDSVLQQLLETSLRSSHKSLFSKDIVERVAQAAKVSADALLEASQLLEEARAKHNLAEAPLKTVQLSLTPSPAPSPATG